MIKGIGIDIIELTRIENAVKRNVRFIDRILTGNEKELYNRLHKNSRKIEFLAGRFAVKEAFAKASGRGIGALSFQHIEVLRNSNNAPTIKVEEYESQKILLSISHTKQYAVAQVIIVE